MGVNKLPAIYAMELHETIEIKESKLANRTTYAMRVPGGWIYRTVRSGNNTVMTEVFVPYSKEFYPISCKG